MNTIIFRLFLLLAINFDLQATMPTGTKASPKVSRTSLHNLNILSHDRDSYLANATSNEVESYDMVWNLPKHSMNIDSGEAQEESNLSENEVSLQSDQPDDASQTLEMASPTPDKDQTQDEAASDNNQADPVRTCPLASQYQQKDWFSYASGATQVRSMDTTGNDVKKPNVIVTKAEFSKKSGAPNQLEQPKPVEIAYVPQEPQPQPQPQIIPDEPKVDSEIVSVKANNTTAFQRRYDKNQHNVMGYFSKAYPRQTFSEAKKETNLSSYFSTPKESSALALNENVTFEPNRQTVDFPSNNTPTIPNGPAMSNDLPLSNATPPSNIEPVPYTPAAIPNDPYDPSQMMVEAAAPMPETSQGLPYTFDSMAYSGSSPAYDPENAPALEYPDYAYTSDTSSGYFSDYFADYLSFDHRSSLEVRGGLFYHFSDLFREIYGNWSGSVGLQATAPIRGNMDLWANYDWSRDTGHPKGFPDHTSITLNNISTGVLFNFQLTSQIKPYVGFGIAVANVYVRDHSTCTGLSTESRPAYGGVIKSGINYFVNSQFYIDGFVDYLYQVVHFHHQGHHWEQVGGIKAGVGAGVRF